MKRIDTHAHIFRKGISATAHPRYVPDYDATLTQYLEQLDHHHMAHGVLIQPSFLGTDNSLLLEALHQAGGRLRGVAVVSTDIDLAALQQLDKAGIVGIRLNLIGLPTPDFTHIAWGSLLEKIALLNWHVEIHSHAAALPDLLPGLLRYRVKIVVDHFGRPDPASGVNDPGFRFLLAQGASQKIWVKLSGAYRNNAQGKGESIASEAAHLLKQHLGLDRLLWGSDWPHTQFENTICYAEVNAQIEQWLPEQAEKQKVLLDTPAALFRF